MAADERAERAIRKCWLLLTDNLLFEDLDGFLFQHGLLNQNQRSRISATRGDNQKIEELLTIIIRDLDKKETFQKFLIVLEKVRKGTIKKELENAYASSMPERQSPNTSGDSTTSEGLPDLQDEFLQKDIVELKIGIKKYEYHSSQQDNKKGKDTLVDSLVKYANIKRLGLETIHSDTDDLSTQHLQRALGNCRIQNISGENSTVKLLLRCGYEDLKRLKEKKDLGDLFTEWLVTREFKCRLKIRNLQLSAVLDHFSYLRCVNYHQEKELELFKQQQIGESSWTDRCGISVRSSDSLRCNHGDHSPAHRSYSHHQTQRRKSHYKTYSSSPESSRNHKPHHQTHYGAESSPQHERYCNGGLESSRDEHSRHSSPKRCQGDRNLTCLRISQDQNRCLCKPQDKRRNCSGCQIQISSCCDNSKYHQNCMSQHLTQCSCFPRHMTCRTMPAEGHLGCFCHQHCSHPVSDHCHCLRQCCSTHHLHHCCFIPHKICYPHGNHCCISSQQDSRRSNRNYSNVRIPAPPSPVATDGQGCTLPIKVKVSKATSTGSDQSDEANSDLNQDDLKNLENTLSQAFVKVWQSIQCLAHSNSHGGSDRVEGTELESRISGVFVKTLQKLIDTLTSNQCDVDKIMQGSIMIHVKCDSAKAINNLRVLLQTGQLRHLLERSLLTEEVLKELQIWSASLRVTYCELQYYRCKTTLVAREIEQRCSAWSYVGGYLTGLVPADHGMGDQEVTRHHLPRVLSAVERTNRRNPNVNLNHSPPSLQDMARTSIFKKLNKEKALPSVCKQLVTEGKNIPLKLEAALWGHLLSHRECERKAELLSQRVSEVECENQLALAELHYIRHQLERKMEKCRLLQKQKDNYETKLAQVKDVLWQSSFQSTAPEDNNLLSDLTLNRSTLEGLASLLSESDSSIDEEVTFPHLGLKDNAVTMATSSKLDTPILSVSNRNKRLTSSPVANLTRKDDVEGSPPPEKKVKSEESDNEKIVDEKSAKKVRRWNTPSKRRSRSLRRHYSSSDMEEYKENIRGVQLPRRKSLKPRTSVLKELLSSSFTESDVWSSSSSQADHIKTIYSPQKSSKKKLILGDLAPKQAPLVPAILVSCIRAIGWQGMHCVGLYKVPGVEERVKELKQNLLQSSTPVVLSETEDIYAVCSCVKSFLRDLSEPLVPFSYQHQLITATDMDDEMLGVSATYQVIKDLPQVNRDTLAFLIQHLQRVSKSNYCQMSVRNLSKLFGPILMGQTQNLPLDGSCEVNISSMDMDQHAMVVEHMITQVAADFWARILGDDVQLTVNSPQQEIPRLFQPLYGNSSNKRHHTSRFNTVNFRARRKLSRLFPKL